MAGKTRTDPFVWIVRGCDGTSVYHARMDCPAITGRVGWLGSLEKVRRSVAEGPGRTWRKRGCRRCRESSRGE